MRCGCLNNAAFAFHGLISCEVQDIIHFACSEFAVGGGRDSQGGRIAVDTILHFLDLIIIVVVSSPSTIVTKVISSSPIHVESMF